MPKSEKARKPNLLFSIDLEEFYPANPQLNPKSTPLPALVDTYLELLANAEYKATFFVVGDVARKYPAILRKIVAAGHELACHGDRHITLDCLNRETFRQDLRRNRQAVQDAADSPVFGFRAPLLSLVKATSWAHAVLKEEGFLYSSSVFPDRNPLFGWPEFGDLPCLRDGIWELPATPIRVPLLGRLPLFCGTYFRVFPWLFSRRMLWNNLDPIISYFHPYDVDYRQPFIMHSGVAGRPFLNLILFTGRKSLPKKIRNLLNICFNGGTYFSYVRRHLEANNQLGALRDPKNLISKH